MVILLYQFIQVDKCYSRQSWWFHQLSLCENETIARMIIEIYWFHMKNRSFAAPAILPFIYCDISPLPLPALACSISLSSHWNIARCMYTTQYLTPPTPWSSPPVPNQRYFIYTYHFWGFYHWAKTLILLILHQFWLLYFKSTVKFSWSVKST